MQNDTVDNQDEINNSEMIEKGDIRKLQKIGKL